MPTQFRSSYTYKQPTEASTWTIPHSLACKPIVYAMVNYEGALQPIIPNEVSYPDDSVVVISFTQPFSGEARLV